MAYEALLDNHERVKKAVMFYERKKMPDDPDEYFCQEQPYKTLNLLMMEGTKGEYVRVCIENQKPNGLIIRRWEKTLEVLTDIFTAQCAYACHQAEAGAPLPNPLSRGDRRVNFDLMYAVGATVALTSTSAGEVLATFVKKKQEPHALRFTLGEGIPYLDYADFLGADYHYTEQREVLLPPMVQIQFGPCQVKEWPGIGPVCHYDMKLIGFGTGIAYEDERKLIQTLVEYASEAADGLDDLAQKWEDAAVFQDPDHAYWKWKAAFRQLVLQRMQMIYERYYGEK